MNRRAIVLDLDGVLLAAAKADRAPDAVRLAAGAGEALRRAGEAGFQTVVVTQASEFAGGPLDPIDLADRQQRVRDLLAEVGARLDGIYTCPHAPRRTPACDCRKPAPGLLLRARDEMGIDLERSWVVGRGQRDLELARAVGARAVLLGAGRFPGSAGAPPDGFAAADLRAAVDGILRREPSSDALPRLAGSGGDR